MTHPHHAQRRQRPNHHGRQVRTQTPPKARPVTNFPVVKKIHYQQAMAVPRRNPHRLSPGIIGLIAAVSAGAAALAIVGSCNSAAQALPCPVPANAATPVVNAPPITCTTSSGSHYVWVHGGGGWVPSRDGIHPNVGARGIGEDEGSSGSKGKGGSGVGDGHGGTGHGGGDGG
jgi:hypothetical protein